jgi:hypothetical protein
MGILGKVLFSFRKKMGRLLYNIMAYRYNNILKKTHCISVCQYDAMGFSFCRHITLIGVGANYTVKWCHFRHLVVSFYTESGVVLYTIRNSKEYIRNFITFCLTAKREGNPNRIGDR